MVGRLEGVVSQDLEPLEQQPRQQHGGCHRPEAQHTAEAARAPLPALAPPLRHERLRGGRRAGAGAQHRPRPRQSRRRPPRRD
eukprot:COSAG01_NODE_4677_length_4823_cov_6.381456_1_plen_82_part_10